MTKLEGARSKYSKNEEMSKEAASRVEDETARAARGLQCGGRHDLRLSNLYFATVYLFQNPAFGNLYFRNPHFGRL